MKYKTIGHHKTFNVNQFCYEKIYLQEEFPSDKPDAECIKELSERIDAMAKEVYPWLFDNGKPKQPIGEVEVVDRNEVLPVVHKEKPKGKAALFEAYRSDISRAESITELETWKALVNQFPDELGTAYTQRQYQLETKDQVYA